MKVRYPRSQGLLKELKNRTLCARNARLLDEPSPWNIMDRRWRKRRVLMELFMMLEEISVAVESLWALCRSLHR